MVGWLGEAAHLSWCHETPGRPSSSSESAEALVLVRTTATACPPPRTGLTPKPQANRELEWVGNELLPVGTRKPEPASAKVRCRWRWLGATPWDAVAAHPALLPRALHALPSSRQARLSAM